jgi:hypothetical protein
MDGATVNVIVPGATNAVLLLVAQLACSLASAREGTAPGVSARAMNVVLISYVERQSSERPLRGIADIRDMQSFLATRFGVAAFRLRIYSDCWSHAGTDFSRLDRRNLSVWKAKNIADCWFFRVLPREIVRCGLSWRICLW